MNNKILIVVDMQNDFIDGSLGTKEAQAIVPKVANKIKYFADKNKNNLIVFTKDTHYKDYFDTLEGFYLPFEHCILGTKGHDISNKLIERLPSDMWVNDTFNHNGYNINVVIKNTFGYIDWQSAFGAHNKYLKNNTLDYIELCGVCTDICVVSNALILRALYPNTAIRVDSSCCAGSTPEKHKEALDVMRSCQIEVY